LKILSNKLLILILFLSAFIRLIHLDYPKDYVFDEVYHAFTAKEYLKESAAAWEWWTIPPPGVAYEWTHPPLAKEIMSVSMFITQSTDAWAYRFPGALLGILSIFLVYKIALELFGRKSTALISALIFSVDGLNFVQSRTGMNDIYLVTFILSSLLFFLKRKFYYAYFFLGLALSSKWTAIYILPLYMVLLAKQHLLLKTPLLSIILVIYLISYLPFFMLGHSMYQFSELQYQMWYYHTHLQAHHDYASAAWTWPFDLYPVWYYVQYHSNGFVSNIFAAGNLVVFIGGFLAVLISLYQLIRFRSKQLLIPLLCYFIFWLPWIFSPRIMFLYHYSPTIPFLSILLGYQISYFTKNDKVLLIFILGLILLGFFLLYPWLVGAPLPKNILDLFFRLSLTKNPFG
jgi:dolichyl-phosphate-mannose-protein mannosyltransferase